MEKKESPKGERAVNPVISLPSEKWVLMIGFLWGFSSSEVVPGHPNVDIHGCLLAGSQPPLCASPSSESVLLHGPETGLYIKAPERRSSSSAPRRGSAEPRLVLMSEAAG